MDLESWEKEEVKKRRDKGFLICPIRGVLRARKYDVRGNYTEEYQRIRLIKYLLQKGYPKSQFIIEYAIPIGHKGQNTLRVDLVIKGQNRFICVAEVKKNYTQENMRSAIKHQLIPAMRIVNAKYGVYFDGTKKSRLLSRNNDGTLSIREFP
ncbi:26240_t:CDS:2 [Gigaspora margarita]|uniref:26240_t:CDS:1 n=1 Tax=Gigaspora margarita TaxID=4874 RepID=A0ABM8VVJ0_GIGMA|nr:26240_t:CDS:2 [Gigaspora margarita]